MIKNGLYALYEGAEYVAVKTDNCHVKLIYNGMSAPQGFEPTAYGNYVKLVAMGELSLLELIKSYAIYGGVRFEIANETPEGIVIATTDEQIARRFNMEKVDRHDYRKMISKNEVDQITQERRKLNPFL